MPPVDGTTVIVHCATSTRGDAAATRNLIRAASPSGNPHLVYVSIVGVDRIPAWGYTKAKLEAERAVADSGMPWTILRATQFYDYMLPTLRRMARLPVIPVPAGFRVQPVDPDEVAARLVELTLTAPAAHVSDVAGPQETSWADLLRGYLLASRLRRVVLPVLFPGTRAVRAGGLLPRPGYTAGKRTWEQFLAANLLWPRQPASPTSRMAVASRLVSCTDAAATFSVTCSGDPDPGIGSICCDLSSSQASTIWRVLMP